MTARCDMSCKSALLAIAIWLAAVCAADASDMVVIDAPDEAHIPARGERLDRDRVLSFADGQAVVLIRQDGEVLRIVGPYEGRLGDHPALSGSQPVEGSGSAMGLISALLSEDDNLVPTLGSSRGTRTTAPFPGNASIWEPFLIGIGPFCIDAAAPVVRRHNAARKVRLSLSSPTFEFSDFVWPAGEHRLRLDASKFEPGKTYSLLLSDRAGESRMITRPAGFSGNSAEVIAWLTEAGCLDQARRRIRQLVRAAR